MKRIEGKFIGSGGLDLYYQSWHPDPETTEKLKQRW